MIDKYLEYPEKALQNLVNVVVAGGKLILTVPNGRLDTFEGHIHFWSPESFQLFLKSALPHLQFTTQLFHSERSIMTVIET